MSSVATPVTNIETALAQLGVKENTLTATQKKTLDEQGYLIIPAMLARSELKELQAAFETLLKAQEAEAGKFGRQEQGTRHLGDLVGKHPAFNLIYSSPELLAAVYHVLKRDFSLVSLTGRDPLPGYGQQGLHADWPMLPEWEHFDVVNSIWLLDDFTAESGGTRVVPGSHLSREALPKHLKQPASHHPQETQVLAPAGSLLIFNAHLWHSGSMNLSQPHRRGLFAMFKGREVMNFSTTNDSSLNETQRAALHPAVCYILDV